MLGQPRLRLIHRQCVDCGEADSFEAYHKLVPPQGQYAFDLIAEVGLARLRDQRQDGEIQRFVQERRELSLPASSIGLIVHSFLDGVSAFTSGPRASVAPVAGGPGRLRPARRWNV
jgi:hypothetical protein